MNFELVRQIPGAPVRVRCRALGVTEQGYYAFWRRRKTPGPRAQQDQMLAQAIHQAHHQGRDTYGTPRLRTALTHVQIRTSRRRISRIRVTLGLKVRTRKRFVRTTDSKHKLAIAANVLNRQFYPSQSNQAWVSDITYLRSNNQWLYLCTVVDCFSGKVIGRNISNAIDATLVCDAVKMACKNRRPPRGCVFHSNRGSQYASGDVTRLLQAHGFVQSMSRKGNCWDNAMAESLFSRLKDELGEDFASDPELIRAVYEYFDIFYNHTRIHSRLSMSPVAFENRAINAN